MGGIRASLIALPGNRRGAAALEMVLIAPALAGMLMIAVDLGNAWRFRLGLEQAAQRGLEMVVSPGRNLTNYTPARDEMVAAWGRAYTNAGVQAWLECDRVRQASFTAGCPQGQEYARYVNLVIRADFQPSFSWGGFSIFGASGEVNLTGDAVARVQ